MSLVQATPWLTVPRGAPLKAAISEVGAIATAYPPMPADLALGLPETKRVLPVAENAYAQRPKKPTDSAPVVGQPDEVTEAIRTLGHTFMSKNQSVLSFETDEKSGRRVVKVRDSITKELIQQIPPDEFLAMARAFQQGERRGLLVSESV